MDLKRQDGNNLILKKKQNIGMEKHCNFCGHDNVKTRITDPIRCPRCGNYYGTTPIRNLTGKFALKKYKSKSE